MNGKNIGFAGLFLAVAFAPIFSGCSENMPRAEAQSQMAMYSMANSVPEDFNWQIYVNNYEDLKNAGIDTEAEAKKHWIEFGEEEKRTYYEIQALIPPEEEKLPPDFDWETYIDNYADLQHINTEQQAIRHWLIWGKKFGRSYHKIPYQIKTARPDFDWQTYVNNYDDLRTAGIDTKEEAVRHWLIRGKKEGRTHHKITVTGNQALFHPKPLKDSQNAGDSQQNLREKAIKHWLDFYEKREKSSSQKNGTRSLPKSL